MSTLTKVFVVLLVIFSMTFTVMTVSIVAQVPDWRDTAEKYAEHARVADTNLRHLIAANAAELAAARDAVMEHRKEITTLQTTLKEVRNEAEQLRAELAKVSSEKSGVEAMNRGLLAQMQVAETARDECQKQRDTLEATNIELTRRNIDLNDRVNEQTAQIVVLQEQKRQAEQQIHILQEENRKLAAQSGKGPAPVTMESPEGAAMRDVVALSPVAPRVITGEVIAVEGNLVTISVGSADGVKSDMLFVIYREDQYVGDVIVNLVDPNESAGRLVRTHVNPKPGDRVTDVRGLRSPGG